MKLRSFIQIFFLFAFLAATACKVKRCASFENQDKDYKLKYDRNGRVKR
jgi:hypothetical protein